MVHHRGEGSSRQVAPFRIGERGRNRTCDPRIKSALLYQLSYAPTIFNLPQQNRASFDQVHFLFRGPAQHFRELRT